MILPKTAVIELTYRCNHKCLFCSCPWENEINAFPKYEKRTELNLEQWKQALNILTKYGVENVSISGGEALLKPELIDILDYIREKKFNKGTSIVLISNGLIMNEDFLSAFKKYNVHLSLSLPGLETFEKHTGNNNTTGVLYWLNRAKKEIIPTTVNITVTNINYYELYETIAHGLIAGADTVLLNRFLIGGRGIRFKDELLLNNEQLNGMLDIAETVLTKANRWGIVGTEFPLCIISKGKDYYKRLSIGSLCAAGKQFFVIDPSGFIRVCNHSPHKIGHIFDTEMINDKKYWKKFANRDYLPKSCLNCNDINSCDCGCRETASIVSGSLSAKDPCLECIKR
jgi:radical SAM protein with 4Fe4S-binding SPASM domain